MGGQGRARLPMTGDTQRAVFLVHDGPFREAHREQEGSRDHHSDEGERSMVVALVRDDRNDLGPQEHGGTAGSSATAPAAHERDTRHHHSLVEIPGEYGPTGEQLRVLLDTGSEYTCVNPQRAAAWGVTVLRYAEILGGRHAHNAHAAGGGGHWWRRIRRGTVSVGIAGAADRGDRHGDGGI
jgi:hypothetical protein